MSLVTILIVEDNLFIAEELIEHLSAVGYRIIGPVTSGADALAAFAEHEPDLVLMDIELEGALDGIATAAQMQKQRPVPIIYLTDHHDAVTVGRAKHTRPAAYIVKPYKLPEVGIAIELAFHNTANPDQYLLQSPGASGPYLVNDRIFLRGKDAFERVLLADLLYVEAGRSYATVVTSEREFVLSSPLRALSDLLPDPPFVRIHRSYVVNVNNIEAFRGNMITINGKELPLGKTYKDEFRERFRFL